MALEFAASRLLTPIFGSSISTWGVLIGIILAALAAGYHTGGRLADSKERPATMQRLCSIIFSSGLYILFIPLAIWPAIQEPLASSPFTPTLVASTLVLIAPPTVLLGIVSPYAIKLATTKLATLGNKAGNLYSMATAGSIAGTFVTVFVLVPSLEITVITFALGLALVIPAAILGLRKTHKVLAGSLVVVVLLATSMPADIESSVLSPLSDLSTGLDSARVVGLTGGTTVHRQETPYSRLQVIDSGAFSSSGAANSIFESNTRSLFLNGDLHSQMYIDYPSDLTLLYTQFFPIGLVFNPDAKNVLFIGGGGFSGPKYFLEAYPGIERVDVVEIDPVVIDVAKNYFGVDGSDSRLNIHNDDGRRFLLVNDNEAKYDIIILDAYSKNYVPFHLMTAEYFRLLSDHLAPDGVIVSNHIGTTEQDSTGWIAPASYEKSKLWRAGYATMTEVFPSVHVFPTRVGSEDRVQNIMLVASKDKVVMQESEIRERQHATLTGNSNVYSENNQGLTNFLKTIDYASYLYNASGVRTDDVPVFTDQYAPVEAFVSPLTNAQYNVTEDGQREDAITIAASSNSGPMAGTIVMAALLIAGVWVIHAHRIWKKPSQ